MLSPGPTGRILNWFWWQLAFQLHLVWPCWLYLPCWPYWPYLACFEYIETYETHWLKHMDYWYSLAGLGCKAGLRKEESGPTERNYAKLNSWLSKLVSPRFKLRFSGLTTPTSWKCLILSFWSVILQSLGYQRPVQCAFMSVGQERVRCFIGCWCSALSMFDNLKLMVEQSDAERNDM